MNKPTVTTETRPKVLMFDEFSVQRGVLTTPPSFPETHRKPGGLSKRAERAFLAYMRKSLDAWQAQRDSLRAEYNELVQKGEIRKRAVRTNRKRYWRGGRSGKTCSSKTTGAVHGAKSPGSQEFIINTIIGDVLKEYG